MVIPKKWLYSLCTMLEKVIVFIVFFSNFIKKFDFAIFRSNKIWRNPKTKKLYKKIHLTITINFFVVIKTEFF